MKVGRALLALAAALALAAVVVLTLRSRGETSLAECEAALSRGEIAQAIVFGKRAAQARVWGSPYPDAANERLFAIAAAREAAGDRGNARRALEAIAAAARSTGDATSPAATRAISELERIAGKGAAPAAGASGPPIAARWVLATATVLLGAGAWLVGARKRPGPYVFGVGTLLAVVALLL